MLNPLNTARLLIVVAMLALIPIQTACADVPKVALGALAVSPDNSTLAAIGVNQVLYLIDPESLEVRERVYVGIKANQIVFSNDGKTLMAFSPDNSVTFFSVADWSKRLSMRDVNSFAVAGKANKVVILQKKYIEGKNRSVLQLIDMSTLKTEQEQMLDVEPGVVGCSTDATRFILVSRKTTDANEEKMETPKELKDIERDNFKQQHDGYSATVVWMDASFAESSRHTTWYTCNYYPILMMPADKAFNFEYGNHSASFNSKGETTAFETAISFHYGMGMSIDQSKFAAGSAGQVMFMDLNTNESVLVEIDSPENRSEYFYGLTFANDGTVFAGSDTFRVVKISPEGKVVAAKPIF